MSVLTLLSDFGLQSPYPAAMKAVASQIVSVETRFIDITHEIRPQGVREGAFVLASVAPECPDGTVHCAVVDPGVGTDRQGLVVVTEGQIFVGPDNGLLIPAAERLRPIRSVHAIDLDRTTYLRTPVSATFHGRDVFAPVAAHLTAGIAPAAIGPILETWETLDVSFTGAQYDSESHTFRAEIVYVDRFGNLITNIPTIELDQQRLSSEAPIGLASASERRNVNVVRATSFGFVDQGDICLIGGSHGLIEIAVRAGSARSALGLDLGDRVSLALP